MSRFAIQLAASVVLLFAVPQNGRSQETVPKTIAAARKQFEQADAELNKVYRICYVAQIVQSQADLQEAQRHWIECRDLTAFAYQRGETGRKRIEDNYYYYALTKLTQSRIHELKVLFPDPFR